MGLLDFFRPRRVEQSTRAVVIFDEVAVTCTRSGGLVESVRWSDLRSVAIQTTDHGPFAEDVFFVLVGVQSGCVVPQDAEGTDALLERLQQLPGFDNHAFMAAMSCTDNATFHCWNKQET